MSEENNLPEHKPLYNVNPETTFDRIFTWYEKGDNYVQLTPIEEEQRKRWTACFSLLCSGRSPQRTAKIMSKFFGISESTAHRDVRSAIKLFGDVNKSDKQGLRNLLFEYSMKAFNMAVRTKNIDQMNKAIANMIKVKGLDLEDPDIPDFSKLVPHTYNINLPDNILRGLQLLFTKGDVNLSDFRNKMGIPIDIEYQEVKDEPGEPDQDPKV